MTTTRRRVLARTRPARCPPIEPPTMAPIAHHQSGWPVDRAAQAEQNRRGEVGEEADRLLGGVQARERVVQHQSERRQQDHPEARAEVAPVDRGREHGDRGQAFAVIPAVARGGAGSRNGEPPQQQRAERLLDGEERRRPQDEPRHQRAEEVSRPCAGAGSRRSGPQGARRASAAPAASLVPRARGAGRACRRAPRAPRPGCW